MKEHDSISHSQGALDRRSTPPAGQDAGVDIEAAVRRRIKHRLRQDQAIGDHNRGLELERREIGLFSVAF